MQLSTYSDKGPLFILIGELTETAKSVGLAGPLPSVLTEFAAGAVDLLNQPSHPIYGKLNKFLQKGPSWNVCKFLAFSVEKILLREPEDDNGQSHEIAWLLNLLIRGLQNDQVCQRLSENCIAADAQRRTWKCTGRAMFSIGSPPCTGHHYAQKPIAGRS